MTDNSYITPSLVSCSISISTSYTCDYAILKMTFQRDPETGVLGYGFFCGLGPEEEEARSEEAPVLDLVFSVWCLDFSPKDQIDDCCRQHDDCWGRVGKIFSNASQPGWLRTYGYQFRDGGAV